MTASTPDPEARRHPYLHLGCGGIVVFDHSGGYCTGCEDEGLRPRDFAQAGSQELHDAWTAERAELNRLRKEELARADTACADDSDCEDGEPGTAAGTPAARTLVRLKARTESWLRHAEDNDRKAEEALKDSFPERRMVVREIHLSRAAVYRDVAADVLGIVRDAAPELFERTREADQ